MSVSLPKENGIVLSNLWKIYAHDRELVTPLLAPIASLIGAAATLAVGAVLAFAALKQAKTSTQVAETSARRHEEQTSADLQRRITENFTKLIEQITSDQVLIRMGAIRGLERIALESDDDYWPIMELLAAYIRERAAWNRSLIFLTPI